MRIISKANDYYDGLMNFDKEDYLNKVWVRNERDVKVNRNHLRVLEDRQIKMYERNWTSGYLIIAGKVHPFINYYKNGGIDHETGRYISSTRTYYYDAKSALDKYNTFPKGREWYNFGKAGGLKKSVNDFFKPYPDMTELCLAVQSPIVLVYTQADYYMDRTNDASDRTVVVDIHLNSMNLATLYHPYEIYQLLDVFISNVMVDDKMPMPPMTDTEKVESHGFDKKLSFRKGKEKKEN